MSSAKRAQLIATLIRPCVIITLRLLVVGVSGTATGLILRVSWGNPELLVLDGCVVAVGLHVWTRPRRVNPLRLLPSLVQELVVLWVLQTTRRHAERRQDRWNAADDLEVERVLGQSEWHPQREAHDVRVYPPQT